MTLGDAAVYVRVSGPDNPATASLESQAERTKVYLESLGYTVVKLHEEHFPGDLLWERPVLAKLREEIRAKKYKAIGVYMLDRLGRSTTHYAILFDEAERHGCKYLSATEELDDTKEGRLIRNIRGYVAEVEHEKIKDRVSRGRLKLKEARKPVPNGTPRFGYTWDRQVRCYLKDSETAEIVVRIFKMSVSGTPAHPYPMSCYKIAAHLNTLGIDSPSVVHRRKFKDGRKPVWRATTIRGIIRDDRYKGSRMMLNKTKVTGVRNEKGRSLVEKVPEDQWTEAADDCPAIVDEATWESANRTVSGAKTGSGTRSDTLNEKKFILLRGMTKCGVCDASMQPYSMKVHRKTDGVTWLYWRYRCASVTSSMEEGVGKCSNKETPLEWLDTYVWDWLAKNLLNDRAYIERAFRDAVRSVDAEALAEALGAHKAAVEDIQKKKRKWIELAADSDDDVVRETFREKVAEFNRQVASHESEAHALSARLEAKRQEERSLENLWELVARARQDFATTANDEEKRAFFRAIGLQVLCQKRNITILLRVPLSLNHCGTINSSSPSTSSPSSPTRGAGRP